MFLTDLESYEQLVVFVRKIPLMVCLKRDTRQFFDVLKLANLCIVLFDKTMVHVGTNLIVWVPTFILHIVSFIAHVLDNVNNKILV